MRGPAAYGREQPDCIDNNGKSKPTVARMHPGRRVVLVCACALFSFWHCVSAVDAYTSEWSYVPCGPNSKTFARQGAPVKLVLVDELLQIVNWRWLRQRIGSILITPAANDKFLTHEDTAEFYEAEAVHDFVDFGEFIDQCRSGRIFRQNYFKMVDIAADDADSLASFGLSKLQTLANLLETGMRRAMAATELPPPDEVGYVDNLTFSLWLGGNRSTTQMHVDDQVSLATWQALPRLSDYLPRSVSLSIRHRRARHLRPALPRRWP